MSSCDLITSARALYNLNNASLSSDETTTLGELIEAVSRAIERFTGHTFCSTQHDELYNGNGQLRLILRHFPIISLERVAYGPEVVLTVTNTSSSNQRATVAVTATGLSLTRVASGTSSTSTLAFATYTTLSSLKTAIDALGNGWSAAVVDADYNNRASADLKAIQGSFHAKDAEAGLKIHLSELADYEADSLHGWLVRPRPLRDLLLLPGLAWGGGVNYWRVIYTAGYATIPEDIQEACAQWVAVLFWQTKRDPGLIQEGIPGVVARTMIGGIPGTVRQLLLPYRSRNFLKLGG